MDASLTQTRQQGSAQGTSLFCPKCVCVLSHWPFYEGFKSCLNQVTAHCAHACAVAEFSGAELTDASA
jgi:hypothetical protein